MRKFLFVCWFVIGTALVCQADLTYYPDFDLTCPCPAIAGTTTAIYVRANVDIEWSNVDAGLCPDAALRCECQYDPAAAPTAYGDSPVCRCPVVDEYVPECTAVATAQVFQNTVGCIATYPPEYYGRGGTSEMTIGTSGVIEPKVTRPRGRRRHK